jgi:hypothetical protein
VFQPQRSPESLGEGVLGGETWAYGIGDNALKLNLKREDREGVEGPVRTEFSYNIANLDREIRNRNALPRPQALEGEGAPALPRKLILSTDMWNRMGCPAVSISISSKKPSTEIYVLSDGIGFLVLYFFKLKWARTGRTESGRLFL